MKHRILQLLEHSIFIKLPPTRLLTKPRQKISVHTGRQSFCQLLVGKQRQALAIGVEEDVLLGPVANLALQNLRAQDFIW